jgi:CRP/FNR family transcriptional regulator, cyclic AMP receptor protein
MIDLIKSCPLFHELFDREIEHIISRCMVAKYESGQMILRENEHGQDFFLLLSGTCIVSRDINGKLITLAELTRGEVFGETVLINETIRSTNVEAKSDCDILIISHEVIFDLYQKNTKVFALLILNLARLLMKRLRASNEVISNYHNDLDEVS